MTVIQHRTLWTLAGACVLVAVLIAAARFVRDERAAAKSHANLADVSRAIELLETDPSLIQRETQAAVRRAAVGVEAGEIATPRGFYLLGLQYLRERDFSSAEALLRRAIHHSPEWPLPHSALGRLLGRHAVGRLQDGEAALRQAIELDPTLAEAWNSLAVVLRLQANLEEAEQAARRAVELAPDTVGPHNNLANLYMALENYDEAEREYRYAIELDDSHAKPYYNLACLYAILGRTDEAIKHLEAAVQRAAVLRLEAAGDPDLASLRSDPRFGRLIATPDEN